MKRFICLASVIFLMIATSFLSALVFGAETAPDPVEELVSSGVMRLDTYVGPMKIFSYLEQGERVYIVEPGIFVQLGTCNDKDDCEDAMKAACKKAGHGDVVKNVSATGDMCSAECADGSGSKAYAICDPASTTNMVDKS